MTVGKNARSTSLPKLPPPGPQVAVPPPPPRARSQSVSEGTKPPSAPPPPQDKMVQQKVGAFDGKAEATATPAVPQEAKSERARPTLKGAAQKLITQQRVVGALQGKAQATQLVDQLKQSGLSDTDARYLGQDFGKMGRSKLKQELTFFNENVTGKPNAARAAAAYSALCTHQSVPNATMSNGQPRLPQSVVHTLTQAVASPATDSPRGQKGLLGKAHAEDAARALNLMSEENAGKVHALLGQAGSETEKALLLKAVAARQGQFQGAGAAGAMNEITRYAGQIRGQSRAWLVQHSTVLDLQGTGAKGKNALQQRFSDSCGCTVGQMLRAESDPMYALQLHGEALHSKASASGIGREQRQFLESAGGRAVSRQKPMVWQLIRGEGISDTNSQALYNRVVKPYTNQTYNDVSVTHTREGRQQAMDAITRKLKGGIDVPIGVDWKLPGGHTMLLSDVRGEGDNRQYLLTDPFKGKTKWIDHQNIVNGTETWGFGKVFGRGSLDNYWA
jgi:hypothetical protein